MKNIKFLLSILLVFGLGGAYAYADDDTWSSNSTDYTQDDQSESVESTEGTEGTVQLPSEEEATESEEE